MTFYVGQKVVRTRRRTKGDLSIKAAYSKPAIGDVVTIKTLNHWQKATILTFIEHDNSFLMDRLGSQYEPGFDARSFRPAVEKGTDAGVALLKKIVDGAKYPVSTRQPEGVV